MLNVEGKAETITRFHLWSVLGHSKKIHNFVVVGYLNFLGSYLSPTIESSLMESPVYITLFLRKAQ